LKKEFIEMPYKSYQTPKRSTRGTRSSAAADAETPVVAEDTKVKTEEVIQETDAEMNEVPENVTDMKEEEANGDSQENGDSPKKKPWQRGVKEGGVRKLPKDVLKRRKNFRLKKLIVPKAPVMILHELLGSTVQFDVTDPVPPHMPNMPILFTAKTVYQENEFLGKGPTKSIAKNICAEQVLQFITTQSCLQANKNGEKMDTEAAEEENGEEQSEANGDTKGAKSFETETPWSSLASLAMFKLFNDWQAQGYQLPPELVRGSGMTIAAERPVPTGPAGPGAGPIPVVGEKPIEKKQKPKKEKTEKGEKTLPENHLSKHPVQLLNEMKGPLEYEETGREGEPPSLIFTMTVKVGETSYSGVGKSKKDAKKAAAEAALLATYNITYQ